MTTLPYVYWEKLPVWWRAQFSREMRRHRLRLVLAALSKPKA